MAYNRRWVGVVFALAASVLLSACGSQEVKLDTPIKTPVLATKTYQDLSVLQSVPVSLTTISIVDIEDESTTRLVKFIASRFKKPESLAGKIVAATKKYAKEDFPSQYDLLAIAAVESTFNTNAHHKGSWGLMQIEAKSHRDKYDGSLTNIDTNIRVGSQILQQYYDITHSKSGAIMAYNVGIGNYLNGKRNKVYLSKVNHMKSVIMKT